MTRKDVKGDQPSGEETTWTNTGATRYGRGQHNTGSFGDDMLRPSPNHGTQRLPNDYDDDEIKVCFLRESRCVVLSLAHPITMPSMPGTVMLCIMCKRRALYAYAAYCVSTMTG